MAKHHKHAHLSNDQLAEIDDSKQSGNIIQSSIKQNECFIKTTLYRDIKRVWFHREMASDISDDQCESIFHKLKADGFISKETNSVQTGVPIYKCVRVWSSQSLQIIKKDKNIIPITPDCFCQLPEKYFNRKLSRAKNGK